MDREEEKSAYERAVFARFIELSDLPVDRSEIRNGDPHANEPDILAKLQSGEDVAFELGRITDANLMRAVNAWEPEHIAYVLTSDPSLAITRKKLKHPEYTAPTPVELVLYKENPVITPDDVIVPTIKPWCCSLGHPYRRIWYMGEETVEVIHE